MKKVPILLILKLVTLVIAKQHCCDYLRKILGARVTYPGDASYNYTESSYWSLQEAELEPACIVQPSTTEEVARAVSAISSIPGCHFAVKGRGHNPAAGFANIAGGVTFDMTTLASIDVDVGKSVAHVGAGASWLEVYRYLDSYGLAAAGGRNGNVGVGGLLLGGGISHFSPRVGWACDGVINFEVVLGNGSVTNANKDSHSDLFAALKGGANNFVIVTRFDLATFAQGNLSSTKILNDISQRAAIFKAFTNIAAAPKFDQYTSLVTALIFDSTPKTWILSNSAVYTKPVLHPPVFAELSAVPNLSNSSSLTSVAVFADEPETPPTHQMFTTATFKPSAQLMQDIFDILNTTLHASGAASGVTWVVALEPLAAAMLSNSGSEPRDVLGLGPDDNGFIMLLSASWSNAAIGNQVQRTARQAIRLLESHAEKNQLLGRFQYLNYAAPYQDPFRSYGEDNLAFLRKVSKDYDPGRVFQVRVPGGFKLGVESRMTSPMPRNSIGQGVGHGVDHGVDHGVGHGKDRSRREPVKPLINQFLSKESSPLQVPTNEVIPGPTEELSGWISVLALGDIPDRVRSTLPWSEKAAKVIFDIESAGDDATIFGWGVKLQFTQTAFPCTLRSSSTHWVAKSRFIDIRSRPSTSYLVGYQVRPRVGLALHGTHVLTSGWHSGAVFGPAASPASVGKLLGLEWSGIEVKRMQHGFAARNGLMVAFLARAGYVGIKRVFEQEYGGFIKQSSSDNGIHPSYLPYASMAGTHLTTDCIRKLQELYTEPMRGRVDDITKTSIEMAEAAFYHGDWKAVRPLTATGAQMSSALVAATQIIHGQVFPEQFARERLEDESVWRLVDITDCKLSTDAASPPGRQAVVIELRDGTKLRHKVETRVEWIQSCRTKRLWANGDSLRRV
ncbi:hypothetical protein G7046_g9676 [Stylonectria norvegica]|nr:hypothetical protein G7046_g9676 [Stylonectria norvegica]